MKSAIDCIAAERAAQVSREGWTPDHDDTHTDGEIARAAAAYALSASTSPLNGEAWWPWDLAGFKPKGARADLIRAGALIVAEIERLDRESERLAEGSGSE